MDNQRKYCRLMIRSKGVDGGQTGTGAIEVHLNEKLQKVKGSDKRGTPSKNEEVIRSMSILFSNHLSFFTTAPLLENKISNIFTTMEIHPHVQEDFRTRITRFARGAAERSMSGERGTMTFSMEVRIEILNIQMTDEQGNEGDNI